MRYTGTLAIKGYTRGYVGFTHVPGLLADGICYFERFERLHDIAVSHTLIVESANAGTCIEAHWPEVERSSLTKYLDDARTMIVFRRPRYFNANLGDRIAHYAEKAVGDKYDVGLIWSQMLANSVVGHWLNKLCNNRLDDWVSAKLDAQNEWICSELVASALNAQPELQGRGCLSRPMDTINPQMLFEDDEIFEPVMILPRSSSPGTAAANQAPAQQAAGHLSR